MTSRSLPLFSALARLLAPVLLLMLAILVPAQAVTTINYRDAPKFALVLGNTDYPGSFKLRNAENDARLIAAQLKLAGYRTELLLNADRDQLYAAVARLADQLKAGGVGAFYYAGHGVEIDGRNYLIPARTPMERAAAMIGQALPVDYLVERLKDSGAHLSLIMLDACRNDPARNGGGGLYRGAAATGFVAQRPANGMLLAYATQPGERALDGSGKNGPFALALSHWLNRPGLPIERAIKQVMTEVRTSTRDEQRPWMATSLVGDFALVPAAGTAPTLGSTASGQNVDGSPVRGITLELNEPAQWFQTLTPQAQAELAREIERQAGTLTPQELPLLVRQAKGGSVVASSVLGLAYRQGFGNQPETVRDEAEAARWLAMAAQQNMPYAQQQLALLGNIQSDVTAIRNLLQPSDPRGKLRVLGYGIDDESKARAIETCDLDVLRLYLQAQEPLPLATPVFGVRGGSNLEKPIMGHNPRLPQVLELLAAGRVDFDRRYMLTFTQAQTGEIPRFPELLAKLPQHQRFGVIPSLIKANALALAVWSGNREAADKLLALGARRDLGVDAQVPELRDGMVTGQMASLQIASAQEEAARLGKPLNRN